MTYYVIKIATTSALVVLPSLVLFLLLPVLLKRGIAFYPSLSLSIGATVLAYFAAILVARLSGFRA